MTLKQTGHQRILLAFGLTVAVGCVDGQRDQPKDGGDTLTDGSQAQQCGPRCQAGTCQPIVLASGQISPEGLALDTTAAALYWANKDADRVMKVGTDGGAPVVLASGLQPWGVAVTSTSVFWTNYFDNSVGKAGLNGEQAVTEFASGGTYPTAIAVSGNHVYWAGVGLWIMDVSGGSPSNLQQEASDLAVDASHVYWTSGSVATSDGAIMRMNLDGTNITSIATGQPGPLGITVDPTSVYWTNRRDGTIMKMGLHGGAASTLATGQAEPAYVTVDDSSVYWTNQLDGTVMKTGIDGGSSVVIASNQVAPTHITADACNLYWVNSGSGTVMKLAK